MNETRPNDGHMAEVVERNIRALLDRKKADEKAKSTEEKIADHITRFAGSMVFVYLHLLFFGVWIIWNLGWLGFKPFDESLVVLAMVASVEAIFISTFVLISQNRMATQADKREKLDLHVSLLAEHEITRLITLTAAMARKMGIEESKDEEIDELARDVEPERVIDTMEAIKEQKKD